jgi:hypothetical protein
MNAFVQHVEPVARAIATIAINAVWQDGLVLLAALLLLRLWPSVNAATRYAVWSVALVAAVALPIATTLSAAPAPGRISTSIASGTASLTSAQASTGS